MTLLDGNDRLIMQTRMKWEIPNDLRAERPKVALDAAIKVWGDRFPENQLRSISNTYNCTGLVIASRRVWVSPEHLAKVLSDDGYHQLPGYEHAQLGDVVIYHDEDGEPTHVGIVIQKQLIVPGENQDPLTILSKWGGDGEYVHKSTAVPSVYGRPTEFWTDRRNT